MLSGYVRIRQDTSGFNGDDTVRIRGYISILQNTSGYIRIHQDTSGYTKILKDTTGYYPGYYRILGHAQIGLVDNRVQVGDRGGGALST